VSRDVVVRGQDRADPGVKSQHFLGLLQLRDELNSGQNVVLDAGPLFMGAKSLALF
jgi:hypothetical protein